ncbi:hypothetical protein L0Y49_01480 [bacterium]|nr:hypothetical protein [bacterium]
MTGAETAVAVAAGVFLGLTAWWWIGVLLVFGSMYYIVEKEEAYWGLGLIITFLLALSLLGNVPVFATLSLFIKNTNRRTTPVF